MHERQDYEETWTSSQISQFPYVQTGGYSAGLFYASWPFGTLEVIPGQLALQGITKSFRVPSECITRLSAYKGLFSRGLRIEHTIATYPPEIIFWSFKFRELREKLNEAGFSVQQ